MERSDERVSLVGQLGSDVCDFFRTKYANGKFLLRYFLAKIIAADTLPAFEQKVRDAHIHGLVGEPVAFILTDLGPGGGATLLSFQDGDPRSDAYWRNRPQPQHYTVTPLYPGSARHERRLVLGGDQPKEPSPA